MIVKSRKFIDVASSSNSKVIIPKLFVSALKLSQAVGGIAIIVPDFEHVIDEAFEYK